VTLLVLILAWEAENVTSESGETHIFRNVPMWLVEVDLSDLGLEDSVVADLLDRVRITLSISQGANLKLNTWRVVHDEPSGTERVRIDAWFMEDDA
jgi:hypothetical protein